MGNLFVKNVCIAKNGLHLKSDQLLIVQVDSIVIRSAKPYLTIPEATFHGYYGKKSFMKEIH